MPDTFNLEVGQSIKSETDTWYRNIQVLGTGGNAVTFLAVATYGPNKGGLFAIKVFRKLSQESRRIAFLNETKFLRSVDHPGILSIYDAGIFVRHSSSGNSEYPFMMDP